MMQIPLIAILAVCLAVSTASAQVRVVRRGDDRLTGINAVDVLVVGTTVAGACAITKGAVYDRAVRALQNAQVEATVSQKDRSSYHSVVITIEVANTGSSCATAVSTDLVTEVAGIPEADNDAAPGTWGSLLIGAMSLVTRNALVIGTPVEHDAAVQHAVERHAAEIAAKLRSANP